MDHHGFIDINICSQSSSEIFVTRIQINVHRIIPPQVYGCEAGEFPPVPNTSCKVFCYNLSSSSSGTSSSRDSLPSAVSFTFPASPYW